MTPQQVIAMLGQPTRKEGNYKYFWEGNVRDSGQVSGNVFISDNQVLTIDRPYFIGE